MYEFRKNGIATLADGKLYEKLRNKRLSSRDKNENLLNWRKLLPKSENQPSVFKQPTESHSVPLQKKATPLDVVGEMKHRVFIYLTVSRN